MRKKKLDMVSFLKGAAIGAIVSNPEIMEVILEAVEKFRKAEPKKET